MQIRRLEAHGLNGSDVPLILNFEPDLNIITGRNGSGKTTILKLLWYIISGNIEHAMREVPFSRVTLETSEYQITLHRIDRATIRAEFTIGDITNTFDDLEDSDGEYVASAESQANDAVSGTGSSLFFPTFRRIEGGFSLGAPASSRLHISGVARPARARGDLEEALATLSRRLSNDDHVFVASLSTTDIVDLLMRKYTEISANSNALQSRISQNVIEKIKSYKSQVRPSASTISADSVLDEVLLDIEFLDRQREQNLAPLTAVQKLVQRVLQHSGIRMNAQLNFGDAANAINSEQLSAGEKQMLSFVCYNAFFRDSVVVIDEPELSLHVDWQRTLFPTLQSQGTSNQFIIATHSPFIYSKFPDKEIAISEDRGASDEV